MYRVIYKVSHNPRELQEQSLLSNLLKIFVKSQQNLSEKEIFFNKKKFLRAISEEIARINLRREIWR